jgi:hypothetical protein
LVLIARRDGANSVALYPVYRRPAPRPTERDLCPTDQDLCLAGEPIHRITGPRGREGCAPQRSHRQSMAFRRDPAGAHHRSRSRRQSATTSGEVAGTRAACRGLGISGRGKAPRHGVPRRSPIRAQILPIFRSAT